ncbi:hypothetical protein N7468_007677 [Penicillium chermesinum]|uniref:CENP-S associating centromere protein X-domain-containing protein n=1 Tax=Penicillium chermesinum TaxID=63820 RepID=A0A9W9NUG5_9EURO|nr:uncharacterized protein N7468_007677 [Penicillium chermesinum]KAJ5226452.1 hypothetical protein N7468_007677 [Penicillium chermesinum]KAJ6160366.1 hypothetical protein N7470_003762 [Penicillium chermesinum]
MAGEPPAKRRQLPFKPPSRTASDSNTAKAGPSTDKGKSTNASKPAASRAPSSAAVASSSKATKPSNDTLASSSKRPNASKGRLATPSEFDSDSESEVEETFNTIRERPLSEEPDYILAEITSKKPDRDIESDKPLITKLLHHHFKNDKTRIAKDADAVVAKYVDTFVREAIARAALESRTNEKKGDRRADGFLEAEDLELLTPQLVMDF